MRYLCAVLEFCAAFVQQKQLEGARLSRRLQVGSLLTESLAELRVHGRVLGLVQRLLEDEKDHALQHLIRVELQRQKIIAELLELLRREFVEDAANLQQSESGECERGVRAREDRRDGDGERAGGSTLRNMLSCLASWSASWSLREQGGTQRRLCDGTGVRPAARDAGPGWRALSVLRPVRARGDLCRRGDTRYTLHVLHSRAASPPAPNACNHVQPSCY